MNRRTSHAISLIYDDAYDLIDGYGWAKGGDVRAVPTDEHPGYCLGTAVVTAAIQGGRRSFLKPAIRVLEASVGCSMVEFNDRQGSSDSVLRQLERLADVYRRLG